jgi:hypothetical protein
VITFVELAADVVPILFAIAAALSPQIGNKRHAMAGTKKQTSNIHLPYNEALQEEYAGEFFPSNA